MATNKTKALNSRVPMAMFVEVVEMGEKRGMNKNDITAYLIQKGIDVVKGTNNEGEENAVDVGRFRIVLPPRSIPLQVRHLRRTVADLASILSSVVTDGEDVDFGKLDEVTEHVATIAEGITEEDIKAGIDKREIEAVATELLIFRENLGEKLFGKK